MSNHTEMYCFSSNKFESDVVNNWRELRRQTHFCDVTLACEDNQLKAHKVILAACSPVLNKLLTLNPHQHPLLYLRGVKYKELVNLVDFMYQGEVNIAQEELNSFLAVAQELKIKGLTHDDGKKDVGVVIEPKPKEELEDPGPSVKKLKFDKEEMQEPGKKALVHNYSIFHKHWDEESKDEDTDDIKTETSDETNNKYEEGFQFEEDPNDFEQDKYIDVAQVKKKIANSKNGLKNKEGRKRTSIYLSENVWDKAVKEGKYSCEDCDYQTERRSNFNKHVKARHLGIRFPCDQCGYKASDRSNLNKHVKSVHNGSNYSLSM